MSSLKTKEEVYLKVDTRKQAEKLKKVLEMFGEDIYSEPNHKNTGHNGMDDSWRYGFSNGSWQSFNTKWVGHNVKTFKEVSIKGLRNILAKSHLKEGDVVILKHRGYYSICEFERMGKHSFEGQFVSKKYCNLDGSGLELSGDIHKNFVRYATDEEKELLNTKKELEVGKWLIIDCKVYDSCSRRNAIIFNNGEVFSYGFNYEGEFTHEYNLANTLRYVLREATAEEVVTALKKEAEIRGLVVGARTVSLDDGVEFEIGSLNHPINNITVPQVNQFWVIASNGVTGFCIFDNGKWTEITKSDEPKVGDVCKFQYSDEPEFVIGILEEIDAEGYYCCGGNCYPHAEVVDEDEAMELLFGDKE